MSHEEKLPKNNCGDEGSTVEVSDEVVTMSVAGTSAVSDEPQCSNSKEASEAKPKKKGKQGIPDFYGKFVSSFESAIGNIIGSEKETKKVLSSLTIEGVADLIRENKVQNIVVMCGAGISTSAGVPDFRSPGTGLYDNLTEYKLPDPMAIFEINFFLQHPEPFFALAKKMFPENLKNIDSLEYLAGIPHEKIVTAHGSYYTSKCVSCSKKYTLEWLTEKLSDENCKVPRCDSCDGIVKPEIVFFGESLPHRFFTCSLVDFPSCDLLIIMGTSLVVQPFASLVGEVGDNVPRLLINLTKVGRRSLYDSMIGAPGLRYGQKNNYRDVFWQGTCDDGAMKLAELLGWKEELQDLIKREYAKIDAKKQETVKLEK